LFPGHLSRSANVIIHPFARLLPAAAALAVLPATALRPRPSTSGDSTTQPVVRADTAPAPFALSDPDGQDLVLERLDVRTAVHGMLALTEVELRFRNPRQRRMEGRFSAVLPEGATVSRFAKEVDGRLVEGEVVERLRAHQVYDQILHQMRDPAMLDQEAGNRFSARVFPIAPGGEVRLVLGYSQLLRMKGGERTWTLPLRGLPKVGLFTFHGSFRALPGETGRRETFLAAAGTGSLHDAGEARVIDRSDENFIPARDLELSWRADPAAASASVVAAGEFYVASFRPALSPSSAPAGPGSWTFYLDTSASGADGAEHRIHALERLLSSLPAGARVDLRAFDHRVVPLGAGTAAQMARAVGPALRARRFLGGTDLQAVLKDAADVARARPAERIVVQTDGIATLGATDPAALRAAASSIPAGATVHALVLGARQDAATLRMLTSGRGRVVAIPFTDSLEVRAHEAARRLALPPGAAFAASDDGAAWVKAIGAEDVQPGDEVLVIGQVKRGAQPAPSLSAVGRRPLAAPVAAELPAGSFAPLLEREAYRAYLDELAERASRTTDDSTRAALAAEEVRVSVEHRVLSPRTTLLVLETEQDYARFGLDRRSLAEILAVGPDGITRVDRAALSANAQALVDTADATDKTVADSAAEGSGASNVLLRREAAAGYAAEAASRPDATAERASSEGPPPPAPPPPPPPPPPPVLAGEHGQVALQSVVAIPDTANVRRRVMAQAVPGTRVDTMRAVPAPPEHPRIDAPEWTRPAMPRRERVDSLRAALRAAPRDREVRNQLADALWARRDWVSLRELALDWQPFDPENPQVYEALGEADVGLGRREEAERALGSLVEVADGKPELLQRAGLLLLRVHAARLAEAPLRRALAERPDRVNGYRHLALMLWQDGREREAARVLEDATRLTFPGWYGDAQRVVHEELGYVLRAWMAREPARARQIRGEAAEYGVDLARRDAMRVTLAWETDGNDVDLHVVDPAGEECYYAHKTTALGLELYQDITQGFGPEVVRTDKLLPGTYHVGVTYFSAGPMGVSRGVMVLLRSDRHGDVPTVQILPFRLVNGDPSDVRFLASVEVPRK
jgi:tetratricopeptide (TPR) repeat protein